MGRSRLRKFPTYLAQGLLVHKSLQLLKAAGINFEPYYFYQEGMFGEGPAPLPEGAGEFIFGELRMEDFPEGSPIEPLFPPREELAARFRDGGRCFALRQGGRVVAFSWCNTTRITFEPCRRLLERREAYLYGAETLFEFRGMRVQPYLRSRCYQALLEEGKGIVYSYSDYFNYPAIRFKEKLGARVLFIGLHLTLFGKWRWGTVLKKVGEVIEPGEAVV